VATLFTEYDFMEPQTLMFGNGINQTDRGWDNLSDVRLENLKAEANNPSIQPSIIVHHSIIAPNNPRASDAEMIAFVSAL